MSRPRKDGREKLVENAMKLFWRKGYAQTSMDDLVRATGVSRGSIYCEFGGKQELFCACMSLYQERVVTPAFARVEAPDAGLAEIEAYFEYQIARMEAARLPGNGCLVANSATELAPHDHEVQALVRHHDDRLEIGFRNALANEMDRDSPQAGAKARELAAFLAISAQGLWSWSRTVDTSAPIRAYVRTLMALVRQQL